MLRRFVLFPDKYSSQFGGGSQYAYFHEEDETSFQLVDTARTQKTAYQRNRMRFAQVTCSQRQGRRAASAAQDSFPLKCLFFFPFRHFCRGTFGETRTVGTCCSSACRHCQRVPSRRRGEAAEASVPSLECANILLVNLQTYRTCWSKQSAKDFRMFRVQCSAGVSST